MKLDLFQTHSLRVVIVIIFTRVINVDFLKFANYKKLLQVKGNQVVLLQRKVSCAAKLLESLAYSSDNVDELKKLLETMNDVTNDFKGCIPKSEGLILLPSLSTNRVRQIKLKYKKLARKAKKYGGLEHIKKQPGRSKEDHKYRHRVGQKADKMRKV